MRRLLLSIFVLLGLCLASRAEERRFTHFDKENSSLCHNGTRAMVQDRNGDLWIGTYMGLSRYDGSRFTSYDRVDFGIDSDYINCLETDAAGNIWIGTDEGVVSYDLRTGAFRSIPHVGLKARIYALRRDADGRMWIGCRGEGLYCYDGTSLYRATGCENIVNPYRIETAPGGLIVADYCSDVYFYDGRRPRPLAGELFLNDDVEGVAVRDSLVYIASKRSGVCEVSGGKVRILSRLDADYRPTEIAVYGDELLVCSTGGILSCDLKSGETSVMKHIAGDQFSLSENFVRFCFEDSLGGLWVGTDGGGLNYYSKSQSAFRKYYRTSSGESLSGCRVRDFVQDSEGNLWVATERAGLLRLDSSGSLEKTAYGVPSVLTAVECMGDKLYLGANDGVYRIDLSDGGVLHYPQFTRDSLPIDSRVVSLFAASDGWVYAGGSVGVMKLDPETDAFVEVSSLRDVTVEDMAEDAYGEFWMATFSQGAYRYDPVRESVSAVYGQGAGKGPVHDMTSSVCVDSDGEVWIVGYTTGFYRYDRSSDCFQAYDRSLISALPGDLFESACSDSLGRLWLAGDSGLVEYEKSSGAVRVYTVGEGLLSNSFTRSSATLSDGSVVMGSNDGFIRFRPGDFPSPPIPPKAELPFWKSPIGTALTAFAAALVLAAAIFAYFYRKARSRDRRKAKDREREMEAENYKEKLNFFSGIIHEIKTPLTLMTTPIQGLLASDALSEDNKSDLKVVRNSVDYLGSLVRELLDFIRVEQHGYVLSMKNVDIVEKIKFLIYNFEDAARARNIRINFTGDSERIVTAADDKALTKILSNLLDNAVKYGESRVNISASVTDESVEVRVRNDGPAISRSHRENIFKPFVRYEAKGHEHTQSFGIGLSLARSLTELHSGTLTLSDGGKETEFVLTLPLREAQENLPSEDRDDDLGRTDLPLLLIVEDNADLSAYIKRKIKSEYRVLRAQSAEQALDKLRDYTVDLVLTDIGLPGMNGVELCRRISSGKSTSHIPVIVVSAISSDDVKIKCVENGAMAFIEKPFNLEFLQATIRSALAKSRSIISSCTPAPAGLDLLPDRDREFVRKFDAIVLENISNVSFSASDIEKEMFLSRSSLSRKLRSLLDTTPGDYIRDRRLGMAAEMLSKQRGQISEICYAVGFSSPSYFAKCFKSQYGMLPGEYRDAHAESE